MRGRRFIGRRRGRGPRRATEWIVSAQGEVTDPAPATGTLGSVALISNADLTEHDDKFTVERIVGQVHCTGLEGTTWVDPVVFKLWSGIALLDTDAQGASIDLNPADGVDADSTAWLWRNFSCWTPSGSMVNPTLDRIGVIHVPLDIDCRVRRKMAGREHLVFFWFALAPPADGELFTMDFQLRTLIKLT